MKMILSLKNFPREMSSQRDSAPFFSFHAARMSDVSTAPPYLMGAVLGGTAMSVISASGTYIMEKVRPTAKSLARDFILGAILLSLIMQVLPDSTTRFVGWFLSLVPAVASVSSTLEAPTGLTSLLPAVTPTLASDEVEVKVGVPRF